MRRKDKNKDEKVVICSFFFPSNESGTVRYRISMTFLRVFYILTYASIPRRKNLAKLISQSQKVRKREVNEVLELFKFAGF